MKEKLFKKILSVALSVLMIGSTVVTLPAAVESSTIVASAAEVYGDYEYEVIANGVAITKYKGTGRDVTIPGSICGKPVINIRYRAFYNCTELISITIPDSMFEIDYGAFSSCDNLTSVNIGNSSTSIGNWAFLDCTGLTNIIVNTGNTTYTLLNGVLFTKDKKQLVFYPCGKTGAYTIPSSVTSIGDYAFHECTGLTSVVIPDSVVSIGYAAFSGCNSLSNLIIPDGVTEIRQESFGFCTGLTNIIIPDCVTYIDYGAFMGCRGLTNVTIGNSVTSIGQYAFSSCTNLNHVTIPDNVSSIQAFAFYNCPNLTIYGKKGSYAETYAIDNNIPFVTIGIEVTGITLNKSLTTITKGSSETLTATITPSNATDKTIAWTTSNSSVATVSNGKVTAVAAGTATITAKTYNNKTATCTVTVTNPTVEVTGISLNKTSTTITKGNSETLTATITPSNATNKTVTWTTSNSSVATVSGGKVTAVAAGTATITAKSNNGKTATCTVTVTNPPVVEPTGITLSGTKVFNGAIAYGEWESDKNVVHATIVPSDATNKTVSWSVGNNSIIEIADTISTDNGSSIIIHGKSAGKTSITARTSNGITASWNIIVVGNPDEYCGPSVTYHLDSNGTLTLRGAGETWDNKFKENTSITKVVIEEGITVIGNEAFSGCSNIQSVQLPNSLEKISAYAFSGCSKLSSITFFNNLLRIDSGAFRNTAIESIYIPASVEFIGDYSFERCSLLKSFAVNENNPKYTSVDGVLYNKDLTQIIKVPEAKTGYYLMPDTVYHYVNDVNPKFIYCKNITDITLGKSYKYRDDYVGRLYGYNQEFFGCQSLQNLNCSSDNNFYSSVNGVLFDKTSKKLYAMPFNRSGIYSVPEGTTRISYGAFINCTKLSGVVVPSSVTEIADKSIGYKSENYADSAIIMDNISSFTIYGTPGSAAETYANNNGITFKNSSTLVFPTSISLNSSSLTKEVGSSSTLTATVYPSDATDKTVIWLTSNPNVATVSNGIVKAVATGTATITAVTNNGKTVTCTVTVTNPTVEVTGITLNKTSTTITKGSSETLTATISPSNATNKTVTWTTSNSSVATVSNGKVTAVAAGTATITAKSNNGKTATCTVTVTNPTVEVTAISLNKTSTTITKGSSETLTATITPSNATNKTVTWTTSNSSVATVSGGKVTAVAAGTATITAKTNNNKTATCTVTVTNPTVEVTGITLNKTSTTITKGSSETLTATISPSNATNKTITWTTSNSSVATVSNGKITAVAAGTATITAKSNNGKTATCKVTITAPVSSSFEWGKDNWNYENSSYYFTGSTYRKMIDDSYLKKLKSNLTNSEYEDVFVGTWYYGYWYSPWLDESWGGSCYGMSSTTLLAKNGLLPYSSYKSGATNLYSLPTVKDNRNVSSLVNYYQMLQIKDIIQQQYRTVPNRSNETNIKQLINLLDNNSVVLVCFKKNGWGGHAILAYGYEYGSYTFNGVTYQGCIKICDPNFSMAYDKTANIYFNTSTYNWTIPAYSYAGVASVKGAVFNYIGADISEINEGGYLTGTSSNSNTGNDSFVSRIDAKEISANRSVSKVEYKNGNYMNCSSDPGDIIEDYSYVLSGESQGTIGYNLYDSDAAYKVSQDNSEVINLKMDYEKCDLSGYSAAGKSVTFDKDGFINVEGESADYALSMVFDDDYPTSWFAVQVSGSNANNASLRKTDDGYVLSADNLENVEVKANNQDTFASKKFDTSYDKVLIYEKDLNTIGLKVDTDNNGTFETDLDAVQPLKNTSKLSESTIVKGSAATVKASSTGGVGTKKYAVWYKKSTASTWTKARDYAAGTTITFTPKHTGKYNVSVKVKDANGTVIKKSLTVNVADVLANTSTLSASKIVKGKSVTVNASSTGGIGTKKYAVWYKKSTASTWTKARDYATGTTITFTPKHTGKYNVSVKVKDAEGTIKKKALTVTVNSALSNTSTLSASTITKGKSVTVKASSTGGVGTKKYAVWYKQASASSWTKARDYATGTTITFTPKHTGKYNVSVKVKDAEGTIKKKALTVTVNSALSNTSTLSASTITKGKSVTVKASSTGGVGTKKYAVWYKQASASSWSKARDYATGTTITFTPKHTGKYNVSVKAKDAEGTIKKKAFTITVAAS